LIYQPSPELVEALPGETTMNGAEAADWARGYMPRPEPGQSRSEWLTSAAEATANLATVNLWTLIFRTERQLYRHHPGAQQARTKLAGAGYAIDRLNAQHDLDVALGTAVATARHLQTILGTTGSQDPWPLDPDTLALIDLYKDQEVPPAGIPANHLAGAWAAPRDA
jgi:hypothetical protein